MQISSIAKITFTLGELSKIKEVANLLRDTRPFVNHILMISEGHSLTSDEINNTIDILDAIVDGGIESVIN